ncbi:MAG: hypothetical protein HMLIMOIP_002671 [Candidatus Nitrosomirales archaeon]|jgi:hypothetical protein
MSFLFKAHDTIFIPMDMLKSGGDILILASKVDGIWLCKLCPTELEKKIEMLSHCQEHIEVK